jgi:hypothetical protein
MIKRLKRIGPVKFGLVVGICYGLISLVFIPFLLLGIVAGSFASAHQSPMQQGLSAGVGILMCVLLPVLYAVLGGLFGMLGAWIYNVVAGWTGGIEFVVE